MLTDWTGLGLDQSLTVSRVRYTFPVISLLMRIIFLDEAKYMDSSGINSIRVGIRGCVAMDSEYESCFR